MRIDGFRTLWVWHLGAREEATAKLATEDTCGWCAVSAGEAGVPSTDWCVDGDPCSRDKPDPCSDRQAEVEVRPTLVYGDFGEPG